MLNSRFASASSICVGTSALVMWLVLLGFRGLGDAFAVAQAALRAFGRSREGVSALRVAATIAKKGAAGDDADAHALEAAIRQDRLRFREQAREGQSRRPMLIPN